MSEEKRYKEPYPENRGKRIRWALAWGTCLMLVGVVLLSVHTRYQAQRDEEIAEERASRERSWAQGTGNVVPGSSVGGSNTMIGANARVLHYESLCLAPCVEEKR